MPVYEGLARVVLLINSSANLRVVKRSRKMSIADNDFFQENEEVEEASASEGYRPISPLSDDDDDDRINGQGLVSHVGELNSVDFQNPHPCNGHSSVENGVSNLTLTTDEEEEEEEEEQEERIRRASELAIARAFREDESRRSAPLTPENASRIVDAMRGISFPGFPPDWAAHVPEEEWMDRLGGLREPTASRN